MLGSHTDMLKKARAGGYAVPAINTQGGNYDIIWAICRAAQELRSPIILAHYASTGAYSGNDWFVEVSRWCAAKVDVPVSIHLDHGDSLALCREAVDLGFTSVMIDGSTLPVEKNAALTKEVTALCRPLGIHVEAEIGELQRLNAEGAQMPSKNIADVKQVREFLNLCRPDSLAIGIGNAHGYYRGEPDIHLEVLEAVCGFTDLPLVLHGCTGMRPEIIRRSLSMGIAKINFGTEIRYKYLQYYEQGIRELNHQGHSWKVSQFANDRLAGDIRAIIRLSGSEGKA